MGFFGIFKKRIRSASQDEVADCNFGYFIKSSVDPPHDGYNILTPNEVKFLTALEKSLKEINLSSRDITLTRLGDGTFNVDAPFCYVGKIRLDHNVTHEKYAVKKQGATRALRVFTSEQAAKEYLATGKGDFIETRTPNKTPFYMQYLIGLYNVKELYTEDVDECVDTIPRWIKYIKYCKRTP